MTHTHPPPKTSLASTLLALLSSVFLASVIVYFLWWALQGDYGWFSLSDAQARIARLETEQALLTSEIADLDTIISGLRGPEIQLDLLDERMRANLGYLRPDEVILYE